MKVCDGTRNKIRYPRIKHFDKKYESGSLKKGKDADLVILSGDPFSVYTHVEQTWIEGQKIWDRSNPDDKKIATGGYGVFRLNTHTHTHEGGQ